MSACIVHEDQIGNHARKNMSKDIGRRARCPKTGCRKIYTHLRISLKEHVLMCCGRLWNASHLSGRLRLHSKHRNSDYARAIRLKDIQ